MEATSRLGLDDAFEWNCSSQKRVSSASSSSDDEKEEKSQKPNDKKLRKLRKKRKMEVENAEEFSVLETFDPTYPKYQELSTVDECERLVVSFPDSSKAWLLYIVFHLKQAEVDKARNVAEKALETISFSEDKEKYNIWLALLNLENMYGTQQSLMAVFDRAVACNESKAVYHHLLDLYIKSNKLEDAEELFEVMVKKFKQDWNIWTKYQMFYMQSGKVDVARKIFEESLRSVDKKFHPDIMIKFARMEYKYGDPEKGKTMFQNVLLRCPKRQDFVCSYVNILKIFKDEAELERVSTLLKRKHKLED